ncbi:MAG: hypothetical protein QXU50_08265 [Candidatus Korarchaeum sp.]
MRVDSIINFDSLREAPSGSVEGPLELLSFEEPVTSASEQKAGGIVKYHLLYPDYRAEYQIPAV